MPRLICVFVAMLAPMILFAQGTEDKPGAAQVDKTAAKPCPCSTGAVPRAEYKGDCVCAMYPVWGDENATTFLYYAVVTQPSVSCITKDIAYFFESYLAYPRACNPEGVQEACANCQPLIEITKSLKATFAGLLAPIRETDTFDDIIPNSVPHPKYPDLRRKDSHPGRGIVGSPEELFATVEVPVYPITNPITYRDVYVKLMYVRAEPNQINPPLDGDISKLPQIEFGVGYEVKNDTGNYSLRLRGTPAKRALAEATKADNPFVVNVEFMRKSYLVMLVKQ